LAAYLGVPILAVLINYKKIHNKKDKNSINENSFVDKIKYYIQNNKINIFVVSFCLIFFYFCLQIFTKYFPYYLVCNSDKITNSNLVNDNIDNIGNNTYEFYEFFNICKSNNIFTSENIYSKTQLKYWVTIINNTYIKEQILLI